MYKRLLVWWKKKRIYRTEEREILMIGECLSVLMRVRVCFFLNLSFHGWLQVSGTALIVGPGLTMGLGTGLAFLQTANLIVLTVKTGPPSLETGATHLSWLIDTVSCIRLYPYDSMFVYEYTISIWRCLYHVSVIIPSIQMTRIKQNKVSSKTEILHKQTGFHILTKNSRQWAQSLLLLNIIWIDLC